MLSRVSVSEYVDEVRQRIQKKVDMYDSLDLTEMKPLDQVRCIVDKDQCKTYIQFLNEFERLVLAMGKEQ